MPDAHAKPPDWIKAHYKRYQKLDLRDLTTQPDLLDCDVTSTNSSKHLVEQCSEKLLEDLQKTFADFTAQDVEDTSSVVYEVHDIPGLFIYPHLLPAPVQLSLLDKLFHRDLSNPTHQTNVHLHYDVPYPPPQSDGSVASFFDNSTADLEFLPKASHQPINSRKLLDKKLRWMTLGRQYDWTNKVYPSGAPPPFPADVRQLVEDIFPMKAEAAIVNLYSPGETLSVHRDVSEECAQPLVSVSLGCEAIFVVGLESSALNATTGGHLPERLVAIKLRSGDAVLMSGESRYAWHGVPKVLTGTCPGWMQDWPAAGSEENKERFQAYKGWMKGKRVNLNVRQMFAADTVMPEACGKGNAEQE